MFSIEIEITDVKQNYIQRSTLKLIDFQPNDRHV